MQSDPRQVVRECGQAPVAVVSRRRRIAMSSRRRFIELEHNKQRWQFYVFKYIKLNSPKVKIPAPKLADEIEKRSKMVKSVKEIFSIIDAF